MLFNDVIYLITEEVNGSNDSGDAVVTTPEKMVYANELGVRQSEFYQADANGLRPEKMFVISKFDYNGESELKHNEKNYSIIRTFPVKNERLEIVCQGVTNGVV